MQSTVHTHLVFLQERLLELTNSLTTPLSDEERRGAELRMQLIQRAIDHYRRAYEIEFAIREDRSSQPGPV